MAKIFISTNNVQPANCFSRTADKTTIRNFLSGYNFPIEQVILVSDNVYLILDSINELPNTLEVNRNEDCLLYHNTTSDGVKNMFDENRIKEGHQTQDAAHFYKSVFEVLLDDSKTDKLSEILKVLGFTEKEIKEKETLESKLNFLHHCLTPNGLKEEEVTKSEWAKMDEFTKLQAANDGPFGDEYLSALRTLRDKLLVS